MIHHSRLAKRGDYGIANSGAVADQVLLSVASEFDAQVMRKISALKPDELATRFTGSEPVLCAVKEDGEGVYVYFEAGSPAFAFTVGSGARGPALSG